MTFTPGACSCDAGPTLAIRSPSTRTANSSRDESDRPSIKWAALIRTRWAGRADAGASRGAWARRSTNAMSISTHRRMATRAVQRASGAALSLPRRRLDRSDHGGTGLHVGPVDARRVERERYGADDVGTRGNGHRRAANQFLNRRTARCRIDEVHVTSDGGRPVDERHSRVADERRRRGTCREHRSLRLHLQTRARQVEDSEPARRVDQVAVAAVERERRGAGRVLERRRRARRADGEEACRGRRGAYADRATEVERRLESRADDGQG